MTLQRVAQPLSKDSSIEIEDITSTKIEILDSAHKILKCIQSLNSSTVQRSHFETLIQPILFKWDSFDEAKKQELFSKYASHELNFFLLKRDKPFFTRVVRNFILNKLEKTVIDWYLLAQDQPAENEFNVRLIEYLDYSTRIDDLNIFENVLVLEVCLRVGSEQQKTKAKFLCRELMQRLDLVFKKTDRGLFERLFDNLLNRADTEEDKELNLEEIDAQLKQRSIKEADRNQGDEIEIYGKSNNNYQGGSMKTMARRDRKEKKATYDRGQQLQRNMSYGVE